METLKFLMATTHYPPHHIGGDAVMVQNLSEELIARGHEVHIVCNPDVFDVVSREKTGRSTNLGDISHAPYIHPIRSRFPLSTAVQSHTLGIWGKMQDAIVDIQRQIIPDVVHWHNTKAFIGRPFFLEGVTNVYTAHDYHTVCPKSSLLRPRGNVCTSPSFCQLCLFRSSKLPQVWRMGKRRALKIPSDFILISPSAFLARMLASERVGVSEVIPNFVPDPGALLPGDEKARNSIVFVGILERHKGPQVLLEAFALSAEHQGLTLEIIGEGSLRNELTERAIQLSAKDRIMIPGRVSRDEIMAAMGRARAVVVPSVWYENCPLSAIEAFSFGVPIIASDIGGLPEIARADAGSTTFTSGSVGELAQELVNVHENRESLYGQMQMARKAYDDRYSPDRHIDMYMKLLK